jgi:hypothetical protein
MDGELDVPAPVHIELETGIISVGSKIFHLLLIKSMMQACFVCVAYTPPSPLSLLMQRKVLKYHLESKYPEISGLVSYMEKAESCL